MFKEINEITLIKERKKPLGRKNEKIKMEIEINYKKMEIKIQSSKF